MQSLAVCGSLLENRRLPAVVVRLNREIIGIAENGVFAECSAIGREPYTVLLYTVVCVQINLRLSVLKRNRIALFILLTRSVLGRGPVLECLSLYGKIRLAVHNIRIAESRNIRLPRLRTLYIRLTFAVVIYNTDVVPLGVNFSIAGQSRIHRKRMLCALAVLVAPSEEFIAADRCARIRIALYKIQGIAANRRSGLIRRRPVGKRGISIIQPEDNGYLRTPDALLAVFIRLLHRIRIGSAVCVYHGNTGNRRICQMEECQFFLAIGFTVRRDLFIPGKLALVNFIRSTCHDERTITADGIRRRTSSRLNDRRTVNIQIGRIAVSGCDKALSDAFRL